MPSAVPEPGESLADLFPEVASQWHPSKNGDHQSRDVKPKSSRRAWWLCPAAPDHEWEATVASRSSGRGCPFCAPFNTLPSSTNNFGDHGPPEIVAEWDDAANGGLGPRDVTRRSHQKVWWRCDIADDHRWMAVVGSRAKGHGCPFCRGLKGSSTNNLRDHGPSEVVAQWDAKGNAPLRPEDLPLKSEKRVWWKCDVADDHRWRAIVSSRVAGRGCPYCAPFNTLPSSTNNFRDHGLPDAVNLWDHEANAPLTPDQVTPFSMRRVWWRCQVAEDHRWRGTVADRSSGCGCPFCDGKRPSSTNNLRDHASREVIDSWDAEANEGLDPSQVTLSSKNKCWWKCEAASDHLWRVDVGSRRKHGCPFCAPFNTLPSSTNNFLDHGPPWLVEQWDWERNEGLDPSQLTVRSHTKVHWACGVATDHRWQARVIDRTKLHQEHRGCAYCSGQLPSSTNNLFDHGPVAILAEWDQEANGDLASDAVTLGSATKVAWKCSVTEEHMWHATVASRTKRGSGCPYCTLTPRSAQEIRLAYELSALIDFDLDVHRVRFAGRLRDVDMVLDDLTVVVEFDGAYWHRNKVDKDREKTALMEEAGWQVIRVRERPLDSIHVNDVMVDTLAPAKMVADLVLNKIVDLTGTDVPQLDDYLASNEPWREAEAVKAIRSYQAERAAKKAARDAKKKPS
jgi:hypothetical protein